MKIINLSILFFFFFSFLCFSQENFCVTELDISKLSLDVQRNLNEIGSTSNSRIGVTSNSERVIMIPVVVHVVYDSTDAEQKVSEAIIKRQIEILNQDFRRLNSDRNNTPSDFQGLAADTKIQFYLACQDPQGNSTNGIVYVKSKHMFKKFAIDYATVAFSKTGGSDSWDNEKFLNIYVADFEFENADNVAGFGHYPFQIHTLFKADADSDKSNVVSIVQIDYKSFGVDQSYLKIPRHLGRMTTHEVGHWLGLHHVFETEFGAEGDHVNDTPMQSQQSFVRTDCRIHPYNDPVYNKPIMFMNYMDYSGDNCLNMFTKGQKARMLEFLNPSTPANIRRHITQHDVHIRDEKMGDLYEGDTKTFTINAPSQGFSTNWVLSEGLEVVSQTNANITVRAKVPIFRPVGYASFSKQSISAVVSNTGVCNNVNVEGLIFEFYTRPKPTIGADESLIIYNNRATGLFEIPTKVQVFANSSSWSVTSNQDWLRVSHSAINYLNSYLTVSRSANYGEERTGTITLTNGSATFTIKVKQSAPPCTGVASTPIVTANPVTFTSAQTSTLTASGCSGTITWNDGTTGTTKIVSTGGTYSATCKLIGCVPSVAGSVTVNAIACSSALNVNANLYYIVTGQVSTLTATGCNGTITWNNGMTGATTYSYAGGTYTATCSLGGCPNIVSGPVTVYYSECSSIPPTLSANPTVINPGQSSTLAATDCEGTVIWSNGSEDQEIVVSQAGTYSAICYLEGCPESDESSVTVREEIITPPDPCAFTTAKHVATQNGKDMVIRSFAGVKSIATINEINGRKAYFSRGTNFLTDPYIRNMFNIVLDPDFDFSILDCLPTQHTAWWGLEPIPELAEGESLPGDFEEDYLLIDGSLYRYIYSPSGARFGVKETIIPQALGLKASPNPTSGVLKATYHLAKDQNVWFNIFDNQGKSQLLENVSGKKGTNTQQFDLSRFTNGTYFLYLQNGLQKETVKVIKK